jgi:hypothetical protein
MSAEFLLSKPDGSLPPPIQMASRIYPHTLLSLDPPSRVVPSMGNTTRKARQTCTSLHEPLQATSCWSVLCSCLPRLVEPQRPTIFHYSLVCPPLPSRPYPPRIDSFQVVQKLSPMETSIRFIPESLSGMAIDTFAGWLVEYVSSAWLGGFGVVATIVCTSTLSKTSLF